MTVLFYFILLHCIKSNMKMTRRLLDSAIYSIEMGTWKMYHFSMEGRQKVIGTHIQRPRAFRWEKFYPEGIAIMHGLQQLCFHKLRSLESVTFWHQKNPIWWIHNGSRATTCFLTGSRKSEQGGKSGQRIGNFLSGTLSPWISDNKPRGSFLSSSSSKTWFIYFAVQKDSADFHFRRQINPYFVLLR